MTVPTKHIKTLTRRLEYLEGLKEASEANSYDFAEIAALNSALNAIELVNSEQSKVGQPHG